MHQSSSLSAADTGNQPPTPHALTCSRVHRPVGCRPSSDTGRKKKLSRSTQKGGPQQNVVVHTRAPAHRQAHAVMLASAAALGRAPELIDAKALPGECV